MTMVMSMVVVLTMTPTMMMITPLPSHVQARSPWRDTTTPSSSVRRFLLACATQGSAAIRYSYAWLPLFL
jgi:hypothetical protein